MNTHQHDPEVVSQGVDELIKRLRDEGVEAGQQRADEIIAKARSEARKILDAAQTDAKARVTEAMKEADALLKGGEEALKTASRDMVLSMKAQLTEAFKADVSRLVEDEIGKPELIGKMILELVGNGKAEANVEASDDVEVILPATAVGLQEIQDAPSRFEHSPLTDAVFGLTEEVLRKGIKFTSTDGLHNGLQIKLVDRDLMLDFSDESVAEMLMQHLQPRFRAILEGVVR